jgi:hypothetical protein
MVSLSNHDHGKDTLVSLLVVLNPLAFALHNACDLVDPRWARRQGEARCPYRLFEHLRSITAYLLFPSWNALLRTILTGVPPPQPS